MQFFALTLSLLALGQASSILGREVCFDQLGCFGNLGAFYDVLSRPVSLLPGNPASIGTTFRLYTRDNPLLAQEIKYGNQTLPTNFDPLLETKVIVHGFKEDEGNWMLEMKDAFLNDDSINVITVDWGRGAGVPYVQAATNTRVVGAELALLLNKLKSEAGLNLHKVHLIGFSLGAHICGYAGERLDKVRRITGLDPAGPMFQDLAREVALDPTDAEFVDAIHTDGGGLLSLAFGRFDPVGHVDFYPNGGRRQPGCQGNALETVTYASVGLLFKGLDQAGDEVICRHRRARKLFLDTLRRNEDCLPVAIPCLQGWEAFRDGQCFDCGEDGYNCSVMGIQAENLTSDSLRRTTGTKLYLATEEHHPYCLFEYNVGIRIPGEEERNESSVLDRLTELVVAGTSYGLLQLTLMDTNRNSVRKNLNSENMELAAGNEYHFLFVSESHLRDVTSLVLAWTPASGVSSWFKTGSRNDLPVDRVQVSAMTTNAANISQSVSSFCCPGQRVTSDRPLQVTTSENGC